MTYIDWTALRRHAIVRDSTQVSVIYITRLGLHFLLLVVLARYLGAGAYGQFAAISAIAIVMGTLSSFGIGFIVLRESAHSSKHTTTLISQGLAATLISTVILLPLYVIVTTGLLPRPPGLYVLLCIALSELLFIPMLIILAQHQQGTGRVRLSQLLTIAPFAIRLLGLGICVLTTDVGSIELYSGVYLVASVAAFTVAWTSLASNARPTSVMRPSARLARQGSGYAAMKFAALAPSELDKALAARFLVSATAGTYSIAARVLGAATLPILAVIVASQPQLFRDLHTNPNRARRLAVRILAAAIALGILAAVVFAAWAEPMFGLLLGDGYPEMGKATRLLACAAPFIPFRVACGGIMVPLGRPLLRSGIEIAGLVLLVTIAALAAPLWGLTGLILAVIASEAGMAVMFAVTILCLFRQLRPETASRPATH